MSPGGGHQFGDTTYTKVFVGGLAWETQKDTMKKYFEQFGEILEAVVITDKATGRSKGYGFVTFKEADAAMRACVDASPVIDGRRANCNLASLGIQRSKPSTPKLGGGGRNFRVMNGFQTGAGAGGGGGGGGGGFQVQGIGMGVGMGTTFPSAPTPTFPHYAIQQGITLPYNVYAAAAAATAGFSAYSPDYTYPTGFYGIYGGGAAGQYSTMYGTGPTAFYPYVHHGEGSGVSVSGGYSSGQNYGVQYPHHLFHYSAVNSTGPGGYQQHYGTPMSLAPSLALQSGVTMAALHAPIPHR